MNDVKFSVVVLVVGMSCLCGCRYGEEKMSAARCQSWFEGHGTESLNITPWLSPKEAVEIFAAHHERTPFFDGLSTDSRLVFVDLDFDGVLEGLAISCDGTMRNTTYTAYRIDPKTRKLVVLRRTGDRGEDFEYEWRTNDVKLIKDKTTGLKRYSVRAFSCDSSRMLAYSKDIGHVFMNDGVVRTVDVASVVNYHDKDEDPYQQEYWCGGKQVDRVFYEATLSRVSLQYYDLNLTLGEVSYWDIDWGNPERFRRLLLSAYLAFEYDGFSFLQSK